MGSRSKYSAIVTLCLLVVLCTGGCAMAPASSGGGGGGLSASCSDFGLSSQSELDGYVADLEDERDNDGLTETEARQNLQDDCGGDSDCLACGEEIINEVF